MRRLNIFWLPLILLIVHNIDEMAFGFPGWATEHFGTTTLPFFIFTHIPILILISIASFFASRNKGGILWRIVASIWVVQFAVNGLFHIFTSIVFREFTPGIISSVIILLPLSYVFVREVLNKKLLTEKQFRLTAAVGVIVYLLGASSLWLDGNIGWAIL